MEIFTYKLNRRRDAQCGVEIYRGRSSAIAIITELPDNPGMSICNAFEDLFPQVVEAFNLDPERIMWIEHWEAWKKSEGAPYDRDREDWDRVDFDLNFDSPNKIVCNARWQPVTQEFVMTAIALLKEEK